MQKRLSHWKRGCCCFFWILLIAAVLFCVALFVLVYDAFAQNSRSVPPPLDVVLVIDHSNSMWEMRGVGSDPDLLRVDAADLFVSYLGVDADLPHHRLAVVHFGTYAELVAPLTSLDRASRRAAVRQAIAGPPRMGWTDPLAALTLAYDELFDGPRADLSRRPAVVLLTDGKPERSVDADEGQTAAYLADLRALVDRFRERDCPIFTIALTSAATEADPAIQTVYRNLWQEVAARTPPAQYHEARTPQDLLHIYHTVVARLSGVAVQPPVIEAEVAGTVAYRVPVEAGLARLTLVILKTKPAVQARVRRPGGLVLQATDPDVRYAGRPAQSREEIWAVAMPREGDWTVELDGQGHVVVWKDVSPLPDDSPSPGWSLALEAPPAYVADDTPLRVVARLQPPPGRPASDPSPQVIVELRRAGFLEATLLARDDGGGGDEIAGDGLFAARYPHPAPGAYTLCLRALREGQEVARWEGAFEIVPLPRLEGLHAQGGKAVALRTGQPMTASVRVAAGATPLDAVALDAVGTLTATLTGPDGDNEPLDVTAVGDHFDTETTGLSVPGEYTVVFHLAGRTVEGLPFSDRLRFPFHVLPRPTPTPAVAAAPAPLASPSPSPTPLPEPSLLGRFWPWALGLAALKAASLLVAGLLWIRRRRAPRLEGRIRVLAAPAGQPSGRTLDLPSNRRQVALGSPDLLLEGPSSGATLRAARGQEGNLEILLSPLEDSAVEGATLTVNDLPLVLPHALRDGDVITADGWRLRYENLAQAAERSARPVPQTSKMRLTFPDAERRSFDEFDGEG